MEARAGRYMNVPSRILVQWDQHSLRVLVTRPGATLICAPPDATCARRGDCHAWMLEGCLLPSLREGLGVRVRAVGSARPEVLVPTLVLRRIEALPRT